MPNSIRSLTDQTLSGLGLISIDLVDTLSIVMPVISTMLQLELKPLIASIYEILPIQNDNESEVVLSMYQHEANIENIQASYS